MNPLIFTIAQAAADVGSAAAQTGTITISVAGAMVFVKLIEPLLDKVLRTKPNGHGPATLRVETGGYTDVDRERMNALIDTCKEGFRDLAAALDRIHVAIRELERVVR